MRISFYGRCTPFWTSLGALKRAILTLGTAHLKGGLPTFLASSQSLFLFLAHCWPKGTANPIFMDPPLGATFWGKKCVFCIWVFFFRRRCCGHLWVLLPQQVVVLGPDWLSCHVAMFTARSAWEVFIDLYQLISTTANPIRRKIFNIFYARGQANARPAWKCFC